MSGTLIDTPAYIPNSVNAVLQTDPVQGKAAGAPFGGIGASNAAAQVLANRTALLYGRQNTNISNIAANAAGIATLNSEVAALIAFADGFGADGDNPGYVAIPFGESSFTLIINFGLASCGNVVNTETQGGLTWYYGATNISFAKPFTTGIMTMGCFPQDFGGALLFNVNWQNATVSGFQAIPHTTNPNGAAVNFYWFAMGW